MSSIPVADLPRVSTATWDEFLRIMITAATEDPVVITVASSVKSPNDYLSVLVSTDNDTRGPDP